MQYVSESSGFSYVERLQKQPGADENCSGLTVSHLPEHQSLQDDHVQVETRHTLTETIVAANQVVQSPQQSLPILILTFCSQGLTFV